MDPCISRQIGREEPGSPILSTHGNTRRIVVPPFGVTIMLISRSTPARFGEKVVVPILGYPFDALGAIKTMVFAFFILF